MTAPARVWAVVPAKSFTEGKSRLAGALTDDARARFARELLGHVLRTLRDADVLAGILVATNSIDVATLAGASGAVARMDAPAGARTGLASVVDGALADVAARGADAAVVWMADLPRIGPADVRAVVHALGDHDIAIVPDSRGVHTNALALRLPAAFATRFGTPDSYAAHCAAARDAGLRVATLANERIAYDVDEPADLAALKR